MTVRRMAGKPRLMGTATRWVGNKMAMESNLRYAPVVLYVAS